MTSDEKINLLRDVISETIRVITVRDPILSLGFSEASAAKILEQLTAMDQGRNVEGNNE